MMKLSANQLNFSGGPGALPESVLQQLHTAMLCVPEVGLSGHQPPLRMVCASRA